MKGPEYFESGGDALRLSDENSQWERIRDIVQFGLDWAYSLPDVEIRAIMVREIYGYAKEYSGLPNDEPIVDLCMEILDGSTKKSRKIDWHS